jgi:hypothetical protein
MEFSVNLFKRIVVAEDLLPDLFELDMARTLALPTRAMSGGESSCFI